LGGGQSGGKAYSKIRRSNGTEEVIKSKVVDTLRQGDRIIVTTAGGGGYGAPELRLDSSIRNDIADRKIIDSF
jgi:N-methylhydantoinase B/oxoprolinase/acetone carboxylase alpha subunit